MIVNRRKTWEADTSNHATLSEILKNQVFREAVALAIPTIAKANTIDNATLAGAAIAGIYQLLSELESLSIQKDDTVKKPMKPLEHVTREASSFGTRPTPKQKQ